LQNITIWPQHVTQKNQVNCNLHELSAGGTIIDLRTYVIRECKKDDLTTVSSAVYIPYNPEQEDIKYIETYMQSLFSNSVELKRVWDLLAKMLSDRLI
jgi:hypothetical protein